MGPRPLLVALIAAGLLASGCSPATVTCGAGTRLEGDVCVTAPSTSDGGADAGVPSSDAGASDAGAPADGGIVLSPGDILSVGTRNRGSDIELLVDTRACFLLSVLHSDGTRSRVTPGSGVVTVAAAKPGVVEAAEEGDCATGGLIGASAGVTGLTVSFTSGGVTITGAGSATVRDEPLVLTAPYPTLPFGAVVDTTTRANALGEEQSGMEGAWAPADFRVAWTNSSRPRDAELVTRWLRVTVADPTIATVTRLGAVDDVWVVRALREGSTPLTVAYEAPHQTRTASRPLRVFPLPPSRPEDVTALALLDERGRYISHEAATFEPGRCLVPFLYEVRPNDPYAALTFEVKGAAFTTLSEGTAELTPDDAGALCFKGSGVVRLTGCSSGRCVTVPISGYEPGALANRAATSLTSAPTTGTLWGNSWVFCPRVRATVTLSTGETLDVTGLSSWVLRSTDGRHTRRSTDPRNLMPGATPPCFEWTFAGPPPALGPGTMPVTLTAEYYGGEAATAGTLQGVLP
ncbi:MAG: hypothetical protein AB1938_01675 [Myxococcota bacterium]